jgi:hypothetical protein
MALLSAPLASPFDKRKSARLDVLGLILAEPRPAEKQLAGGGDSPCDSLSPLTSLAPRRSEDSGRSRAAAEQACVTTSDQGEHLCGNMGEVTGSSI